MVKKGMKRKPSRNTFLIMILFVALLGYFLSGGPVSHKYVPNNVTTEGVLVSETPYPHHETLQLKTLYLITATPTPTVSAALPSLCQQGGVNNEQGILVGFLPASGQSVSAGGQIKVWVNDEGAPKISEGEVIDSSTGQIKIPGNQTAKAPDNYLWEPALYIAPQTAESGGTPHFINILKGNYNNHPNIDIKDGAPSPSGPAIDPPPPGSNLGEQYTAEYIWNVNSLGLTPGTYTAEFVIHDGDDDRGVGCVTITIL